MKFIVNKPHLIFLLAIPIIMLIGIFSGDTTLDINVHDTYYVIAYFYLTILISILFGIIGIGYWLMLTANRKLSKWLNLTHIVLTIGGIVTIILIPYLLNSRTESEYPLFDGLATQNLIISIVAILIFFGQLIYISNLIIGIFNKNKTSG